MNIRYNLPRWGLLAAILSFILFVSYSGLLAASANDKRGIHNSGLILEASLDRSAVIPGGQVCLRLLMRNDSKQSSQQFLISDPTVDYSLIVKDDKGRNIPKKKLMPFDGSLHTESLPPGRESVTTYPLTISYDINKLGTYSITASRKIYTPDDKHTSDLVSNTVILTVAKNLSKDFTLTTSLMCPTVKTNMPTTLLLTLRNISKAARELVDTDLNDGYSLMIQDFRGDVLFPFTKVQTTIKQKRNLILKPNDAINMTVDIDKLFKLCKEGCYYVTAMYSVPNVTNQEIVFSDTISFTISAKESRKISVK